MRAARRCSTAAAPAAAAGGDAGATALHSLCAALLPCYRRPARSPPNARPVRMRMRSIIAQVARRLNNRAAVGEDRGTEIHPIYMQADSNFTAAKTGVSTLLNPIFRIPLPPLNQEQTTRTAATADCRSTAGLRQPGPAPLSRHPAAQQSRPQIRQLALHARYSRGTKRSTHTFRNKGR